MKRLVICLLLFLFFQFSLESTPTQLMNCTYLGGGVFNQNSHKNQQVECYIISVSIENVCMSIECEFGFGDNEYYQQCIWESIIECDDGSIFSFSFKKMGEVCDNRYQVEDAGEPENVFEVGDTIQIQGKRKKGFDFTDFKFYRDGVLIYQDRLTSIE